jgi:predicted  nucleic acid-binding Zn-ribbon protein
MTDQEDQEKTIEHNDIEYNKNEVLSCYRETHYAKEQVEHLQSTVETIKERIDIFEDLMSLTEKEIEFLDSEGVTILEPKWSYETPEYADVVHEKHVKQKKLSHTRDQEQLQELKQKLKQAKRNIDKKEAYIEQYQAIIDKFESKYGELPQDEVDAAVEAKELEEVKVNE